MKNSVLSFLLTLLALVTAACGSGESNEGSQSAGPDGEWVLESLVLEGDMAIPLPDTPLDLRIDGSEVGGDAGCNSMGGSASFANDGSVLIRDLFWTAMACADTSLMDFEQRYTQAFSAIADWSLDGERLRLTADGVEAVYTPRVAPPDLPITGTVWTLDTFFDDDAAMNAAGMDDVTVTFSDSGVRMQGRCWVIPGFATIEPGGEGNLSVDFSTADPDFTCDDRAFFGDMVERLSAVNEYRIDEHRLTLGAGGNESVSLRG